MAVPDPLDEYQLSYNEFYAELPSGTDYLNDIDPSISDEHDDGFESTGGLSAEQVSEIARDSLDVNRPPTTDSSEDPQLFPPSSTSS